MRVSEQVLLSSLRQGGLCAEFLAPLRQTDGYALSDRSGRACAGNPR